MDASTSESAFQGSIPLPGSLDTRIFIRLTRRTKHVLLFLTTATADEQAASAPLGSFVYALPDRYNANQPLATTLYSVESTLEFATRLAKLLAKKTHLPVYVGNSMSLSSTTLGGTVEEEMDAFKAITSVVLAELKDVIDANNAALNGIK